MQLKFIYLNSPPVVAVNWDNRKTIGKKNDTKQFEKFTKNDSIEFRKKKKKWEKGNQISNQQIAKTYVVKVVKNCKVITMYLIMVTVITGIIMKMMVMLMIKDNNK